MSTQTPIITRNHETITRSFDLTSRAIAEVTIKKSGSNQDHDHWLVTASMLDHGALSPYTMIADQQMSTPRHWIRSAQDQIWETAITLILYCKEDERGDSTLHPRVEWDLCDLQEQLSGSRDD